MSKRKMKMHEKGRGGKHNEKEMEKSFRGMKKKRGGKR